MRPDFDRIRAQLERGIVDPAIFLDEEIYRLELERVWKRSWVFVAHESMIPQAGDYVTSCIGEDPVIVVRSRDGRLRVLLNRCRHRGVKLCPYDRGNAKVFSCVYHGWAFANDGTLVEVPEFDRAYAGHLERREWGLIEVPQVLRRFRVRQLGCRRGAARAVPGRPALLLRPVLRPTARRRCRDGAVKQRVRTHHNWKVAADNASDMYHFGGTHAGAVQTLEGMVRHLNPGYDDTNYLATLHERRTGLPSHTLIGAQFVTDPQAYDLEMAARLGADSVAYVRERHAAMAGLDPRVSRGTLTVAGIFPSMTVIDVGPLSVGVTIELYHAKGPRETETWLYVYVDKDAPSDFKRFAAQQGVRFHSFTGSVVPADHENWERLDEGTGTSASARIGLSYALGLGGSGGSAAFRAGRYEELPGAVDYCMSERGARSLYRHWLDLMQEA